MEYHVIVPCRIPMCAFGEGLEAMDCWPLPRLQGSDSWNCDSKCDNGHCDFDLAATTYCEHPLLST